MYPDQSLYAYDSVPTMVRRINNTFKRADEIQWSRGINPGDEGFIDYFLPIVADAEAGFGGTRSTFAGCSRFHAGTGRLASRRAGSNRDGASRDGAVRGGRGAVRAR